MNARRRCGYTVVTVAAVGAALLLAAAPSAAASKTVTKLTLTVTEKGAKPVTRTLTCAPAGGSHPHAADACVELASVSGKISKLPEQQGACMDLYRPAKVTASGRWNGRTVSFKRTYPNKCNAQLKTGSVFSF